MQRVIFLFLTMCGFTNPIYEGVAQFANEQALTLIEKYIPEDAVIFEAGAHYGTDTIYFSKKWPKGKVISFEPNPNAFENFLDTTAECSNVYGYNLALNTYNGNAIFHICYGTTGDNPIFEGASSLLDANDHMKIHYRGPDVIVPCVVLDDWCRDHGIDHIDFMWLDLEGLELQVLQSSPKILETVKAIHVETNFQEFRVGMTQYKDLKPFLENNGFKVIQHWYTPPYQGNAIFVRKEPFEN